jgi:hypothetical protein
LKRLPVVAMMDDAIGDTNDIMQQSEQTGPNLFKSKTENNDLK